MTGPNPLLTLNNGVQCPADATGAAEQKVADLREPTDAFPGLPTALALDDLQSTRNRR
jgi:hypothetical protein